jgi:hypothetical protein
MRLADAGAGAAQEPAHDPVGQALRLARRRIGFGDQHVAIGQQGQPPRMLEPGRERAHVQPRRRRRAGIAPVGGRRDVDDRNALDLGADRRARALHRFDRQRAVVAQRVEIKSRRDDQQKNEEEQGGACDPAEHGPHLGSVLDPGNASRAHKKSAAGQGVRNRRHHSRAESPRLFDPKDFSLRHRTGSLKTVPL